MEDGEEKEAIYFGLNLCEAEIEIQNKHISEGIYNEMEVRKNLVKLKTLSQNSTTNLSISSCRKLCNKLGIYLVF